MSSVQLDDLPVEVFEQITQYLSLKECVRLERVNSKWRNAMRKEWRRLKKLEFDDPVFSRIFYILRAKNNNASCVDPGTVCLQELAVKIHNHVQTVAINNCKLSNRHVVAFMKKLYELSTPKLRELTLYRNCLIFSESDAEIMAEVAQYTPSTLESLKLRFVYDVNNAMKYFWDDFYQQTYPHLKSLSISYDGPSDFRMNVLQTPNLKELEIRLDSDNDETVFDIDNLDQLTDLEILSLSFTCLFILCEILETATSHDSKFLQTLKKLELDGDCNDEQLLSQIGRFSMLEVLELPKMKEIDTAGQLRIVQSIGQGCANLKSLRLAERKVEDEVLIEVADCFPHLSFLHLSESSVQQIGRFVNRLSVDRFMEIECLCRPREEEVQDAGILNSHPNIRYERAYWYDSDSD